MNKSSSLLHRTRCLKWEECLLAQVRVGNRKGASVELKTWVLNYFVNGSRGWVMACNMVTNVVTIVRKVIARAAQMDFSTEIAILVALQDFIGHVASLPLEFGVSHLLVFVESSLSSG